MLWGGGCILCAPYRVILDCVLHAPVSVSKPACRGSEKERRFLSNFFAEVSLGTYKLNVALKLVTGLPEKGKITAGWTVVSVNTQDLLRRRRRRRRRDNVSEEDLDRKYEFLVTY